MQPQEPNYLKKVWELNDNNTSHNISWRIIQPAHPYKGGIKLPSFSATSPS